MEVGRDQGPLSHDLATVPKHATTPLGWYLADSLLLELQTIAPLLREKVSESQGNDLPTHHRFVLRNYTHFEEAQIAGKKNSPDGNSDCRAKSSYELFAISVGTDFLEVRTQALQRALTA